MLLGAVAMLLLLLVALAALWWLVTDPVDDDAPRPVPSAMDTGKVWGLEPPADLREGEAWFAELDLEAWTMVAAGSELRDVTALGQDVVTSPDAIVAARMSVEATVPFEVVMDEIGDGVVVSAAPDGQATVVRSVEVQGRELSVTATGTVEAAAGRLLLEPLSIDVGGLESVSDELADVVRRLVTIEHEVEGLPEGLVLEDVAVQGDGFRVILRGEDVELVP
ncbi:MAG: hypothetical protein AVDCRST_MAG32-3082 [uncultured Nocardioides sp.]|uniref:DUF2993 domain-containing protein n=1 Tax=uncultured Nocardioides sp. TaxID=198441 RepID=A0A6J4P0Q0_9ACTN|nr:MAG: hypothetical protein AVDCRST_MAG32-3082 [uncultured Nocardioides sp.]